MPRSSDSILSFFCDLNYTHYGESNATQASIISRSVVLFVIMSVSFVENLLVFLVLFHPRPCLTKSQYFVINMCAGNQLITLLIMPFSAVTVIREKWIYDQIWCAVTGFIFTVLINNLIFTIFVITAERLYAVMNPLNYSRHVSKRKYMGVIAGTWVGSFIFALLPIVAGALSRAESLFQYHPSMYTCTLRIPASYFTYRLYLGIYICITYILPQTFILLAYVRLFYAAHKSAANLRRHGGYMPTFHVSNTFRRPTHEVLEKPIVETTETPKDDEQETQPQDFEGSETSVNSPVKEIKPTGLRRSLTISAVYRENRVNRLAGLKRTFSQKSRLEAAKVVGVNTLHPNQDHQGDGLDSTKGSRRSRNGRNWSFRLNRRSMALKTRVQQFVGKREELQAAKTALFIIGSFIICISPYFVVLIMDVIAGNDEHASTSTTRTVSIWSLFTLCAITPALYFYRNRHIRCLMKQMLGGGSGNSQLDKTDSKF